MSKVNKLESCTGQKILFCPGKRDSRPSIIFYAKRLFDSTFCTEMSALSAHIFRSLRQVFAAKLFSHQNIRDKVCPVCPELFVD